MTKPATPPEIRAAAKYLERRRISSDEISPRLFAQASKDLNQPFKDTLNLLKDELEYKPE